MVPVDDLDEGTHRGAAEDLLVGHRLGDAAGAAADARDEAVAVVAGLGAIEALHDDSLLARIAAVQKDDNLAGLEESLAHDGVHTKNKKYNKNNRKKSDNKNKRNKKRPEGNRFLSFCKKHTKEYQDKNKSNSQNDDVIIIRHSMMSFFMRNRQIHFEKKLFFFCQNKTIL